MNVTLPNIAPEESPLAVAADAHAARARPAWRTIALVLVGIELVLLYAPTVRWLWSRWTMSVWHNAHGMFVPPLAAFLAWHELKDHPELRRESGSAVGFVLLAPALILSALDAGMHTELLSSVSLVLALPGLSLL